MQLTSSGTNVEPINGTQSIVHAGGRLTEELAALEQFYCAFNTRDLRLMESNWLTTDEAIMSNPLGGVMRGWSEIRSVYERIFDSAARVRVEFHDYSVHIIGSMFYAVGRERGFVSIGARRHELAIRATRLFRLEMSKWRQVHHHGSLEDPEMLRAYQSVMRESMT